MKIVAALMLSVLFFGLMVGISYDVGLREDMIQAEQKAADISQEMADAARDVDMVQTVTQNIAQPISHSRSVYPWKQAVATVFWVGEVAGPENAHIANAMSAFDMQWEEHYGGYDDPDCRSGYHPCGFVPKENPFYIALPYSDFEDDGTRRSNAPLIPWYDPAKTMSNVKNRWIEVQSNGKSCFGQWQDVGPLEENDFEYVFGAAQVPRNSFGERAGIDLSPAVRDCLQVDGSSQVRWRHVDDVHVPEGPWLEIVTR